MKKGFKKCLSLLLCAIMVLGSVAVGGEGFSDFLDVFSIKATATGEGRHSCPSGIGHNGWWDISININASPYTDMSYVTTWGYYAYSTDGCAWFATSRVKQLTGKNISNIFSGATWYNEQYANYGFSRGSEPKAGSLACYSSHIAVVEKIVDGNAIISEGGWSSTNDDSTYDTGYCTIHSVSIDNLKSRLGGVLGFVYFTSEHTHTYKESAKITLAPTKTSTGTRVRTCSCGDTYTQTIPAIPYTTDLKEGVYVIRSKYNSNLVAATNESSGYNVFLANFESSWSDQYWIFNKNSDGTYSIENLINNGYVFDVYNNSMVNQGNICAYPRKSTNYNNERFYIVPSGSYYKLVSSLSYNVIDAECPDGTVYAGSNISQYEDNGGNNQLWSLTLVNPSLSLSSSSVSVSSGSSKSVSCTIDREISGHSIAYSISNSNICSASFGSWNGMTIPLTITGKSAGTTNITVTLKDKDLGIVYSTKTITVTVPDTTKPTGSISSTNNVASSQTVTLSMSDNAGIAGYYWGTNSSYSSNTYTAISGTSKSVTKTVSSAGTYYLTVKDTSGNISSTVSKTFYKTTLNANSGSVSPSSVITMSGNSFTLPTPTRSEYSFKNWNTVSGGTGTSYTGSYKPTGSATLYAQWTEKTYTVSFSHWCHGFEGVGTNARNDCIKIATTTRNFKYSSLSISTEDTLPASSLPNGIRIIESHYGKYGTSGISGEWSYYSAPQTFNNIAKNIDFQIDYELINYTITYNLDGGTLSAANPSTYNVVFGAKFTNNPTKTGYTFDGWTIDGTNKVTGINESVLDSSVFVDNEGLSGGKLYNALKNRTTGNKTVRALWKAITFAVSYNANGGSGAPSSQTKTYGTTLTLSSAKPTRTGYIFQNWNTKADGTGTSYSAGDSYTADADVTLYAQWKELFKYSVSDGKATITSFDKDYIGEFIIPDKIDGYPVTGIGNNAFINCTGLTSITIPDSVTSIGQYAFSNCSSLTEITIPGSVKSMGSQTFLNCTGLKSVTIENGVTSIPYCAFKNCTGLTSVTIPDSVTSIGEYAFSNCSGLTEITIPGSVESMGSRPFLNCTGLKNITIEDGVTSIPYYAFDGCTEVTGITIPSSITNIESGAFNFKSLTDICYLGSSDEWNEKIIPGSKINFPSRINIHFINDEAPFKSSSNIKTQKSDIVNYVSGFNLSTTVNNISQLAIDGWNVNVDLAGNSDKISTGSSITMTNSSITYQCIAVIFGDVNGDGWYDGTDSIIVNCLANGILSREQVGEAVYMAADCNHDGVIDQLDVDILNQAGVLLSEVDQTKSEEELLETSSVYVQYLNLIQQSPETEKTAEKTVENTPTDDKEPTQINWFEMFVSFLKTLLNFVYGLFTL